MLKIAVCDDSRTDVEMLESAFDKLRHYPVEYDVYFSGKELIEAHSLHDEVYLSLWILWQENEKG